MVPILDSYINVVVQGISQVLHAHSNTMTWIQRCDCPCAQGTCDEEENISVWRKASKKPQFFWLQTTNAMWKSLSMNVNTWKHKKPEYISTFHQHKHMKLFMTLLATGRWLHPGYQSNKMPQSDVYRFMVQAYDLLLINQHSISGDELSPPWYGNTHRPSSKKNFVTVNSTKKFRQWTSGIQQVSCWMVVGLNFRGKIISATHYHNSLDGFRGTVQRNRLGQFNTDVIILQDNATPHTAQKTNGSSSTDGKCCSTY